MKTTQIAKGSICALFFIGAAISQVAPVSAQCIPPPSGLVGWWPGNGNANDASGGGSNGILMNGTGFTNGIVGQAFSFDGVQNFIEVPSSPVFNPNQGQGWSVECWINPASISGEQLIVHKGNSLGTTDPYDFGTQYWTFGLANSKLLFEIGHTGYNVESFISIGDVATNQWSHVAVVIENIGGPGDVYTFYINGNNAGSIVGAYDGTVASITTSEPLRIGVGNNWYDQLSGFFHGSIDELAIYNRSLSATEVGAIFAASGAGKCSSPFFTTLPQNQFAYWGGSATFSVQALPPPLIYQWQSNGVPIIGATNSTLTLLNVQDSFAASYNVTVSNSYGSTNSSQATLTVGIAGVAFALYPGLQINGVVGQTYGIQYSTNLSTPTHWIGITNLVLNVPQLIWYDSSPATGIQRYYQVKEGPITIP